MSDKTFAIVYDEYVPLGGAQPCVTHVQWIRAIVFPSKGVVAMKVIQALLVLIVMLMPCSSAWARWQVSATWQVGGAAPTYTGIGDSKAQALAQARLACQQAQPLKEYQNYCLNEPTRESYSELPEGTYIKSCGKCRVEGAKLVCDYCKPKIERRELDLAQCTSEAIKHIENCHGDLNCSSCP